MTKILQNNSSYLIALPPAFIKQLGWKRGTGVQVFIRGDKLEIRRRR